MKLDHLLDAIVLPPALEERGPTAPSSAAAEAAGDDIGSGGAAPGALPPPLSSATPGPAPAAPASPPGPTTAAALGPRSPSVYISDPELLKAQPVTDDGEVSK